MAELGATLQLLLTKPSSVELRGDIFDPCHNIWPRKQMKLFPSNQPGFAHLDAPAFEEQRTLFEETRFMPKGQWRSRTGNASLRLTEYQEGFPPSLLFASDQEKNASGPQ